MHGISDNMWVELVFTVLVFISEPLSAALVVIGFIATIIALVVHFIVHDNREDAKSNK